MFSLGVYSSMGNSYERIPYAPPSEENDSTANTSHHLQVLLDMIFHSNKEDLWRSLWSDIGGRDSVNIRDADGNTPLLLSVKNDSVGTFTFLLNLRSTQIDARNSRNGLSALTTAVMLNKGYYVLKLIKKGADVNIVDNQGCTPLHYAVKFSSERFCKLLISSGANLNAQNLLGETPMHTAYQYGNTEKVCMLLYHGADPSIPCKKGNIPLLINPVNTHKLHLRVTLGYYMFGDREVTMEMKILVRAMVLNSPLVSIMMKKVCQITYDEADLRYLNESLPDIAPHNFQVFFEKFDHIVKHMLNTCHTMTNYLTATETVRRKTPEFVEFLYILLDSHEAVQSCCKSFPVVASLVKIFRKHHMPLKALTELVCCLLSYGLNITPTDLNAVYIFYGRCELFDIMLHIDIEPIDNDPPCCIRSNYEDVQESVMAQLIYDIDFHIDRFLERPQWFLSVDLDILLDYFALTKLKDYPMDRFPEHKVSSKVAELPTVPHLTELSRNAAREFIIKRYHVQNCRQFYTVIRYLPINNLYKRILTYENKLYNL